MDLNNKSTLYLLKVYVFVLKVFELKFISQPISLQSKIIGGSCDWPQWLMVTTVAVINCKQVFCESHFPASDKSTILFPNSNQNNNNMN